MPSTHAERWGVERRPGERAKAESPQLTLADARTHGGRRDGAGRKKAKRANVAHVERPEHTRWCPVHVTLRCAPGLPSLRSEAMHLVLMEAVRETRRDDFRIAHYSVQSDHMHMIVEALTEAALTNGVRSFEIRAARRVNARVLGRKKGRVWGDRYHRRDLGTPTEVRNALVYVLANGAKHGRTRRGELDPCSSGPWFEGWVNAPPLPAAPSPVQPPSTWLLEKGWVDVFPGFLFPSEAPRSAKRR